MNLIFQNACAIFSQLYYTENFIDLIFDVTIETLLLQCLYASPHSVETVKYLSFESCKATLMLVKGLEKLQKGLEN